MRRLGDKRISDSRRGYFALGCCDRAYGGLMRRLSRMVYRVFLLRKLLLITDVIAIIIRHD